MRRKLESLHSIAMKCANGVLVTFFTEIAELHNVGKSQWTDWLDMSETRRLKAMIAEAYKRGYYQHKFDAIEALRNDIRSKQVSTAAPVLDSSTKEAPADLYSMLKEQADALPPYEAGPTIRAEAVPSAIDTIADPKVGISNRMLRYLAGSR